VITVPRRSRWCKRCDRRSLGRGSPSPMTERRSCSPAVSRLRPSQGTGKNSRAPVRWCDVVALEKEARGGAEGQAPRSSALREQRPNSGEPLRRCEGLPRRAEASSGCGRAKRCSWRGVVADGELERTESPTPTRARGGGERRALLLCCGCGEWRKGMGEWSGRGI
jgi:hypothetical protein